MDLNKIDIKKILTRNEVVLMMIILIIVVVISSIAPVFLTKENFFDILRSSSFIGVCSVGFLLVLLSGGIDISFTATATVAQYTMGLLLANYPGIPVLVAIVVPIAIGCILGSLNALIINSTRVPAIIITIGTLNAYYGAIQFISNGRWLYDFPPWFREFPRILILKFTNEDGVEYGLSILTAIWFAVALLGAFILWKTVLGRKILAVGGNPDAANRAGVNNNRIRLFCYSFLGGISGLGAIVHGMLTQTVAPNSIVNLNFDVLAAVVIGGANIFGGEGTVLGSFLGVLLVAIIKNGLTIMKVPQYGHQVFIGAILLVSVAATAIRTKKTTRKRAKINVE